MAIAFEGGRIRRSREQLREEQRVAHAEVFQKYFTLSVPEHQLSDHEARAVITGWKETDPGAREARMLTDLSASAQDGTLPQMLDKLRVFLRKEGADIQIAMAQMLFRYINQFRGKTDDFRLPSESYHGMRLMIFQLIDNSADENAIQSLLTQVILESPSLDVAAITVKFSGNRETDPPLNRIVQHANRKDLSTSLATRLKKDLVNEMRDVFDEESGFASLILRQWGECDRTTMNDYVFSLLERVPGYTAKIIDSYPLRVGSPRNGNLDYPGLVATYDEKRLYDSAVRAASMSNLTDQERQAVQAFIRGYDDLKLTATKERQRGLNRAKFSGLYSEALHLFDNGQYLEALKSYDEAVSITDWEDSHGWQPQVRYYRWRCLLEVAFNDGQPIQTYFNRADQESPTEHAIKGLFNAAFPNGPSVQAQAEFYNCLFYYLKWFFASDDVRTTIRKSFDDHAVLAKSDQQSTSLPFIERIAQLKIKMSEEPSASSNSEA